MENREPTNTSPSNSNPPPSWCDIMVELAPDIRALVFRAGERYAHSHYGGDAPLLEVDRHADEFIAELCQFLLSACLPGDSPTPPFVSVNQIDAAHVRDWYHWSGPEDSR